MTRGWMGALVVLLGLTGCGEDTEEEAPQIAAAPGEVALPADAPAPAHEGSIIAAGPHYVEVLAHDDGSVDAYLAGDDAPAPAQSQVTVHVPADDGETHPVVLVWDPAGSRYRGRLRRVQPVPGPVRVVLATAGETYQGNAPTFVVMAPRMPRPTGGPVHAARPVGRPTAVVERPGRPGVVVERPGRPGVVVQRRGPPGVVVHRPGRPGVVVRPRAQPRTVVVERPRRPAVVVEAPGRPGRRVGHRGGAHPGRGHARGHDRDRDDRHDEGRGHDRDRRRDKVRGRGHGRGHR